MSVRIVYVKGRACVRFIRAQDGGKVIVTYPIPCGQGRNVRSAIRAQAWYDLCRILHGQ